MLDKVAEFRKYKIFTGQFARFQAAGHTENDCFANQPCGCTGQNGGRINLFKTELRKQNITPKPGKIKKATLYSYLRTNKSNVSPLIIKFNGKKIDQIDAFKIDKKCTRNHTGGILG